MTDHPLKMKERLKSKKRPTAYCRILVGDQEELEELNKSSVVSLLDLLKESNAEMTPEARDRILDLAKDFTKKQEPFFQRFVFRAMHPVAYEKLTEEDEYKPRPGTDDIAFNYETFPIRIFRECLIEPAYETLTDSEWNEFLENCSQVERRLLLDTALTANQRNIEPSTPKGLMTL